MRFLSMIEEVFVQIVGEGTLGNDSLSPTGCRQWSLVSFLSDVMLTNRCGSDDVGTATVTSFDEISSNRQRPVTVAEVEVDTESGEARVIRALTVHDCGFPVNPALVKGQIDGQVSMALGHAFLEEVMMKDGYTLNPTWLDYRMPTIHEMAESDDADVITEQYTVGKPYRVKEVGEGLVSGVLAAIANALYDATGVRMHSTPFSPEKILVGLQHLRRQARGKTAEAKPREGETVS